MTEWISIQEKLPPQDGTTFLGFDPNAEDLGRIYVLIYDIPGVYLEASGERYSTWKPTHWMPLPEAPNE